MENTQNMTTEWCKCRTGNCTTGNGIKNLQEWKCETVLMTNKIASLLPKVREVLLDSAWC